LFDGTPFPSALPIEKKPLKSPRFSLSRNRPSCAVRLDLRPMQACTFQFSDRNVFGNWKHFLHASLSNENFQAQLQGTAAEGSACRFLERLPV
jgi:hypothetical protein